MKIKNLVFIACLAIVQTITTNEIALPIGLGNYNDSDLSSVSQTQEEQAVDDLSLTKVDDFSLTTMKVICDCNDSSCVAKSEPIIEEPVRGLW